MKRVANERVQLYPDSKYRWIYEVNMLTNYSILIDVWKVLGISMFVLVVLFIIITIVDGNWNLDSLLSMVSVLGIMAVVMLVLGIIGYFVYAAISGWKYSILFIMDEKAVTHQQMSSTVKKGQLIGALAILAALVWLPLEYCITTSKNGASTSVDTSSYKSSTLLPGGSWVK